jgi:hypothetical protein
VGNIVNKKVDVLTGIAVLTVAFTIAIYFLLMATFFIQNIF